MREEYYYYWLGRIRGIGLRTIEEWIKEGYTPEQFYRGDSVLLRSIRGMTEKMKEQILDPVWKEQTKKEWELCQKEEIRYYSYFFKDYPVYLRKYTSRPENYSPEDHCRRILKDPLP